MNAYQAIKDAIHEMNLSHYFELAMSAIVSEHTLKSVVYRPKIFPDGNMWCALYGDNIQEGVCGFGKTPEKAIYDFNEQWDKEMKCPQK